MYAQANERDRDRGGVTRLRGHVYVYIRDRPRLHVCAHENAHVHVCDHVRDYLTFQPPAFLLF